MRIPLLTLLLSSLLAAFGCGQSEPTAPPLAETSEAAQSEKSFGEMDSSYAEAKLVMQQVRELFEATYSADVDTVLSFTHPIILEQMGGEDQARQVMEETLHQVGAEVKLESLEFRGFPHFITTPQRTFAIIPITTITDIGGERTETRSVQLGVKANGQTDWKYLGGEGLTKEAIIAIFPDFPSRMRIPPTIEQKL